MRYRLSAVLTVLMISARAQHAIAQRVDTNVPGELVGAWRLVALDERGANGQTHNCDCTGMFVFTSDGHAAVQVLYRNAHAAEGSAYSQGGYEASFGSYVVDQRTHTFTLHVEGALVRNLIGKDLPRRYEIAGKRLIVRPTSAEEDWSVTWERY